MPHLASTPSPNPSPSPNRLGFLALALTAVALVLQSGVPVSRCEILDGTTVAAFNASAGLTLPQPLPLPLT